MKKVKWTICVPTVPVRAEKLAELMERLLPQVDKYEGQIEVLIFFNNFERSIGWIRQQMLEDARGEYVSSIDDDDMIPTDYCDAIFPLLDGVDYIGFQVKLIDNGKIMAPVYHSLKYLKWSQDEHGYYRGITHLNPLRTNLALASGYPIEWVSGEDEQWALGVKAKTERYIDRDMYYYFHNTEQSVAYNVLRRSDTPIRPKFKSKNVRFHPESTQSVKT